MHKMSSGQPYPPDGDLGGFAPSGEPKSVQSMGKASTDGTEPDEGDAALSELGASIKSRKSSSSVKGEKKVPISLEADALAKSVYNRPA